MLRINKYLLIFTGISGFLGIMLFTALQKYLPILLKHVVYYCQELGHSLSVRIPHQVGGFVVLILIVVALLLLVQLFISYIKIYLGRKRLHALVKSNADFVRLTRKLAINKKAFLIKDSNPFAFCHGIRSPKIYVSTALMQMLTEQELEVILRHESYHLRGRDSLTMLFASIAQSLFPFFPVLSDLIQNYRIEREIQADQEAIKGMNSSKHLIAVMKKLLSCDPIPKYSFSPAIADHDTLEARIKVLTKKGALKTSISWKRMVVSLFSVGLLFNLIMLPVQAVEIHGQEEDVIMVCLKNDSCSMRCKGNETITPYIKILSSSVLYTPTQ